MTAAQAIGRGVTWRPRGRREVLADLQSDIFPSGLLLMGFGDVDDGEPVIVLGGGPVPGELRCAAVELERGDCRQRKVGGSAYCYYHDKLQRGLTEPEEPLSYPVWPLPQDGYVMLDDEEDAA